MLSGLNPGRYTPNPFEAIPRKVLSVKIPNVEAFGLYVPELNVSITIKIFSSRHDPDSLETLTQTPSSSFILKPTPPSYKA